jgi:uncharacterized protein YjbI with pentapeptide repeats
MAQLQGAALERANLAGANLMAADVWRARFSVESIGPFYCFAIVWDSKHRAGAANRGHARATCSIRTRRSAGAH